MRSKFIKCKNMRNNHKNHTLAFEKKAFAANVLQIKHEKCPTSVFAGCPNERLLLRSMNKVKGHQVQKRVKYNKYST